MIATFVVEVSVECGDLDPSDLCIDVGDACAQGVYVYCDWVDKDSPPDAVTVEVFEQARGVVDVEHQGTLL